MSAFSRPAVGIDLGTTFSAIAHLDSMGRPVTLVNAEGDLITPSVVLFEGTNVVVGKEAVKALATEGEHVALCAKRDLGHRMFHNSLGGRNYPPEVIQAFILNKRAATPSANWATSTVVITFRPISTKSAARRRKTPAIWRDSTCSISSTSHRRAIAYGSMREFLSPDGRSEKPLKVMVYDLGGGTFDVTVMEIKAGVFTTLSTDGDVQLGGRDWDQRLMDFVAEEFIRSYSLDPREDPNAFGRLWRECEDCKRTLSARMKTTLGFDYQGHAVRVEVTREKFVELTRDLLDRTAFTARQTLQAAGLEWSDLDHVLLVGGSTRMPMVIETLRNLSGRTPDASVSADEAVAHGAALRAGLLLAKRDGKEEPFRIRNVNSHSLGVAGTDPQTRRKRNAILIPRNTPLPVSAKRVFKTSKPGQKSVLVQIVEGESASPDDCSQIGKCSIRDLPADLPAQTPIEVRFRYEENGRLTVQVSVSGTDKELKHEIERENSLTADQLDSWRQYITGVAGASEATEGTGQMVVVAD